MPKCGGKKRQSEGQCTRPAGWGTSTPGHGRCKLHGGATRNHRIAAQRQIAEEAVRTLGLPIDIGPVEALLEEVRWAAGHVAWLRTIVAQVQPDALVWGVTEEVDKTASEFPGTDVKRAAAPNVWVDLYLRFQRQLVEICRAAVAAGAEERRVRWAEQQGASMAGVFGRVLDAIDLSVEQRTAALAALEREIGLLIGEPAAIEGSLA